MIHVFMRCTSPRVMPSYVPSLRKRVSQLEAQVAACEEKIAAQGAEKEHHTSRLRQLTRGIELLNERQAQCNEVSRREMGWDRMRWDARQTRHHVMSGDVMNAMGHVMGCIDAGM